MFRQYVEHNEHEGETWNFWLQVDGNEKELETLADILQVMFEDCLDESYVLEDEIISEAEVDTLCRFGGVGYINYHNKVCGVLMLPESPDEEFDRALYKGGIEDFFEA